MRSAARRLQVAILVSMKHESPTFVRGLLQGRPVATHALATLVLIASLLVVLAYWRTAYRQGVAQAESDFRSSSQQAVEVLRQRLLNHELLVRGGASLQAALQTPNRDQWQRYVAGLGIGDRFPGLEAFGFALDAQPQELGALRLVLPGLSWGDSDVRQAATPGDMHAFVLYQAPLTDANRSSSGIDLASEPVFQAAMREAAETSAMRMSAPVQVIPQGGGKASTQLGLFAPVFAGNPSPGSAEEGGALRGWVFERLWIAPYVRSAALDAKVPVRIVDTTGGGALLVHATAGFAPGDGGGNPEEGPAFTHSATIDVLGRQWRFDFVSPPLSTIRAEIPGLRTTLIVGLLASLLVFGIALTLARTHSRAHELATRMSDSLRRSEQRFRSAMEYSAIGKALLDRQGRIIETNPALRQILGTAPGDLVGTMLGDHFVEGERDTASTREREAISDGAYRITRRLKRSDGDVRHASLTFAMVPGDSGEEFASLVQVEDITERLRAETRVKALNRTLEARVALRTRELSHANQELESFAYSVSHDLRAPLRSIDGFSRLLSERYAGAVDDSGRDYLARVRKATTRMSELIDALLKMSRVSRGELKVAPVDLSGMASEILAEQAGNDPGHRVEAVVEPGLDASADASLLRNLMQNLIGNAWKFTRGKQGARIVVGRNPQGEFFVQDNGAGFASEYADKLFRPFQRLHSEEQFAGHGIGLASVKRILARHGGSIRAEGVEGEGATFFFTLPSEPNVA